MDKPERVEQILQLEPPHELRFKGPFNEVVPSKLELTNPTDKIISFKVKTTAPRRYCVRPNSGVVKPFSKVPVMLMLQPFEYNPYEKNKHKFMVQALYTPDGDTSVDELFKQAKSDQLMETKLRCVFDMPAEELAAATADAPASLAAAPAASGDTAPVSSSTSGADAPQLTAEKVADFQEQIAELQAEISALRQREWKLKEEKKELTLSSGKRPPIVLPHVAASEHQTFSQTHMLLAFLMVLLGYLLAKFVF